MQRKRPHKLLDHRVVKERFTESLDPGLRHYTDRLSFVNPLVGCRRVFSVGPSSRGAALCSPRYFLSSIRFDPRQALQVRACRSAPLYVAAFERQPVSLDLFCDLGSTRFS